MSKNKIYIWIDIAFGTWCILYGITLLMTLNVNGDIMDFIRFGFSELALIFFGLITYEDAKMLKEDNK